MANQKCTKKQKEQIKKVTESLQAQGVPFVPVPIWGPEDYELWLNMLDMQLIEMGIKI